jgi:hypothetical protein
VLLLQLIGLVCVSCQDAVVSRVLSASALVGWFGYLVPFLSVLAVQKKKDIGRS